eukprot:1049643-Ditylum_brightwellii.AAC.1
MEKNFLCGILPTGIWHLPNLHSLRVCDNNIGGQIPPRLNHITRLRRLIISNNTFSGSIEGTIPAAIARNKEIGKAVKQNTIW